MNTKEASLSEGEHKTVNPPYDYNHTEDFYTISYFNSPTDSYFSVDVGCSHLEGTKRRNFRGL